VAHAVKTHKHSIRIEKPKNTNDRVSFHARPIRTSDSLEMFEGAPQIRTLKQVTDNIRGAKALATAITTIVTLVVAFFVHVLFGDVGLALFICTTSCYTMRDKEINRWWMNQHKHR
jgi:hypothetical protein